MNQQTYHLVHANIAVARAPLDHPIMAGFIDQVDRINDAAQASPGFAGQPILPDDGEVFSDRRLLNLSIWGSLADLDRFTHHGLHALALERRSSNLLWRATCRIMGRNMKQQTALDSRSWRPKGAADGQRQSVTPFAFAKKPRQLAFAAELQRWASRSGA